MRLNLSSMIALSHVEERLYKPESTYEASLLTKYERIPTSIYATNDEAADVLAREIADAIAIKAKAEQPFVLMISGGTSPMPLFSSLIQLHQKGGISFDNVHIFPMYEFYPLASAEEGVLASIKRDFLDKIAIPAENIHGFDVSYSKNEINQACVQFMNTLESLGGIDALVLGSGRRASVGMNAPGVVTNSSTRLTAIDETSRQESAITFNSTNIPLTALTIGLNEVMSAKRVYLLAWGEAKAKMMKKVIEEASTTQVPASILQRHHNAKVFLDLQAAEELTRINHPWKVTTIEWNDKLIRRAIVDLCLKTNKPILKLTNQDYTDHQLSELITLYGSAYNVNIKVFNDIQHTITGWPAGKPNVDDSNRPERATPFPKKVIVFSPHPDDDVISMGGTFRRLAMQGHDVHVCYETSGNIAVGDEEVIRYVSYLRNVCEELGMEDSKIMQHALKLRNFLMNEKVEGSVETEEVRFMKGTIRREEARTAARFVGLEDDHIHFLDLPFYETGTIKKNPLSEADVKIVMDLLQEIKPDQIFVAGDLADPHGTHKVALNAVFAAIDELDGEEWLKNCWIWMYRGAWAEWEIDHIEMAVPMSPEELRHKRNSILKHQSQMESAPFLGDDERLFWQRSEDRNRATAELYSALGLASYEAIEAFVRYHPIKK